MTLYMYCKDIIHKKEMLLSENVKNTQKMFESLYNILLREYFILRNKENIRLEYFCKL